MSLILLVAGCASTRPQAQVNDASITGAAAIADRIDDKAVVVETWLKSH